MRFGASSAAAPSDMVRALELHEATAHRHGPRVVRDLGDAIMLLDPTDRDPFLNRISGLRLPSDRDAFDRRLVELLALFASLDRRPHVLLSPRDHAPADLAERLGTDGFVDRGGTYLLVLRDEPAAPAGLPAGTHIERLSAAGGGRRAIAEAAARVMLEAFDTDPESGPQIADDLARPESDAWDVCLALLGDVPVAAGRRYTADGMTYLSSIATRPAWRGRGFGSLVTAALADDGRRAGGRLVHLGVDAENERAQRLYARLGFTRLGDRSADLLLG